MVKPLLLLLFVPVPVTLLLGQSTDTPAYTWSKTGPLQIARQGACAAALPDGRILVAGGQDSSGPLRSVEIYQQDGTFSQAQDLVQARSGHTCTSLADGRVLVAGGVGAGPAAEIYDPAANNWIAAEDGVKRWNQTATLLSDGRVLLAGGETSDGPSPLLEWFNPLSNRIRALPASLAAERTQHASALLGDGSVLITGGWNAEDLMGSVEIVKLDGTVQSGPALPAARAGHTATTLDNGCVLIAGGIGEDGDLKSASVYCADSGKFQAAGDMGAARYGHLAVSLPNNGKVLVAGGFSQGEVTGTSELFDADSNTFQPAGLLTLARLGIAAAADPASGAVLAVGGYTADGPVAACGILRGPSLNFDKSRYLDGDPVTVSGLGWTNFEKVNLSISTTSFARPGQLPQISFSNLQTTASAVGRIQQTLFTASPTAAGATFKVTATGVTSGLTATTSARQIARTSMTLTATPSPALTRQPVTLQAVVQPAASLDPLDGMVSFQLGSTPLGSVTSSNQFTSVSIIGKITDGTSNTLQVGETLPPGSTGFGGTFVFGDGSVRTITPGAAFQLVTLDIPAGTNGVVQSISGSYTPFNSLYGPSSASGRVTVQKRSVNVNIGIPFFVAQPKVGDPIPLTVSVIPTQFPLADVAPTGSVHLGLSPGSVVDVPTPEALANQGVRGSLTVTLPAGTRTLTAQYDGDSVYQPGSQSGTTSVTIAKGTVGFAVIPGKPSYTVGEPVTLVGRILHPKVNGATPSGQITRTSGPSQFQGAAVGADPQSTGLIDTNLPVIGGPAAGNFTVTMTYGGDANFLPATAGVILTIAKGTPLITVIAPAQVTAGQQATFTVRAAPVGSGPPVTGQVALTGVANGAGANLVANSSSSVATIRQTFPIAGTFTIAVQYGGDNNYLTTTSATVQVVVQ